MPRPRKPLAEIAPAMLYSKYRDGASRRNIPFELSIAVFSSLIAQPCHYCNYVGGNKFRKPRYGGTYRYNGIDRAQNTLGYVETNCVACCFVCNRAKQVLTLEQWHDWIRRIAKYADRLETP